jgi:hypothetical protein
LEGPVITGHVVDRERVGLDAFDLEPFGAAARAIAASIRFCDFHDVDSAAGRRRQNRRAGDRRDANGGRSADARLGRAVGGNDFWRMAQSPGPVEQKASMLRAICACEANSRGQ